MELMKEMFPIVVDQDRWALERQQKMFAFAEDGYSEVHLRSDKSILIVRKILEALEKGVTKDPNKSWLAA
jgi:vanillate O-demethylase monooxygenase subunit